METNFVQPLCVNLNIFMPDDERLRLLFNVAYMHYVDNLTQTEISHYLKTSGTQVGRLLTEAKQNGILNIEVRPPQLVTLGAQLVNRFSSLKEALVIPAGGNSLFSLQIAGKAAASYFDRTIDHIQNQRPTTSPVRVGISGGNTIYEMILALPFRERNVTVCPDALIGRGPLIPENKDNLVLVTHLWEKCGRKDGAAHYATVPPFETAVTADAVRREYKRLLARPKIKAVWDRMHETDIIFSSVGPVNLGGGLSETPGRRTLLALLSEMGITEQRLKKEGIVGEMSYSMFDRDGNTHPDWQWFMTLGVNHFKNMAAEYPRRRVVLIAGSRKKELLHAALGGGLCNVLITDDSAAEYLLST